MIAQPVLSAYISRAMAYAEYDKLEDGSFGVRISQGKTISGKTIL